VNVPLSSPLTKVAPRELIVAFCVQAQSAMVSAVVLSGHRYSGGGATYVGTLLVSNVHRLT
jgi:hypothetical protein